MAKMRCSSCGAEVPEGFRFCGRCGAQIEAGPAPAAPPPSQDAERRQLSVMFCDLVGSTSLSEELDPEDLRDLVRAYQRTCVEVVDRYKGHVAQYLGDGLLVYFGYPTAHEDDARRAVHAGLDILEAMERLNREELSKLGQELQVRLGIHTGMVVAGAMGAGEREERLALGQTPNIAARLQGLAEPQSLVLSAASGELVRDFFVLESLGARSLKGVSEPMELFRVVQDLEVEDRFAPAIKRGLSPLVGRQQELERVDELFRDAADGRGQLVLITGESGIGKSRLMHRIREMIKDRLHDTYSLYGSAYAQDSAFRPLIELLTKACRQDRGASAAERLERIEDFVADLDLAREEAVPLLATLLGVPLGDRYRPLTWSPQRQKEKTLELLLAVVRRAAEQGPLLLILEDLHWFDPSTLEFVELLRRELAALPVLALLSTRPSPELEERFNSLERIALERLGDEEVPPIIERVAGGKALPPAVVRQIVANTDGVPLFVEELTKTLIESRQLQEGADSWELVGDLPDLVIPTSLHDSLMARLDRLSRFKVVAQIGAVVGRDFGLEMLEIISGMEPLEVRRCLDGLVEAELIFQVAPDPEALYTFKHAMIREVAYDSLLKSRRRHYHASIAGAFVDSFPDVAGARPELVAHHFTEAGRVGPAIDYWLLAGQVALQRSANIEAERHLRRGISLLDGVDDEAERRRREVALQTALGPAMHATFGYAAPEVEQVHRRALDLCLEIGEAPELIWVLAGLGVFYQIRSELKKSLRIVRRAARLIADDPRPELELLITFGSGSNLFWLGDFRGAAERLQAGRVFSADDPHFEGLPLALDSRVGYLDHSAMLQWHLGAPDTALAEAQRSIALARQLARPFDLAHALNCGAWVRHWRGEPEEALALAEETIAICEENGIPPWLALSSVTRARVLAGQGRSDEAIAVIQACLGGYRSSGARLPLTYVPAVLAEVCLEADRLEQGLEALDEALAEAESTDEGFWKAEIHRLRGEVLRRGGAADEAESSFERALGIATSQGSRALELRCRRSLGRLWGARGEQERARESLARIIGQFSEGLETAELRAARSELAALS